MDTQEVLSALGISRTTLFRLMKDGKLEPLPKPPYLKRARKLQFRRADVERLKSSQPMPPEPTA